jgi:type IV pilus assembly protein PilV
MKRDFSRTARSRSRGFSLIEVLITILILAIGLLGMAALQAVSMRSNQSANFRTQATALAYMIIDRMRANSDAVQTGGYLATDLGAFDCAGDPTDSPIATHDIEIWRQQIACQLPEGKGAIEFPGDKTVVIEIAWTDARWALVPAERSTSFKLVTTL